MEETYSRLACVGCGEKCAHRVCECCGAGFISERKKKYCSKRCTWTAQDRKAGVKPAAEYRAAIKNPASLFNCEHCGAAAKRNLGGANTKKGTRNRWCSMACKKAQAAEARAPRMCAYWAMHCQGCGAAGGSKREWTHCPACKKAATARAAHDAARTVHAARAKVVACNGCGITYCPVYGAQGKNQACPDCTAARHKDELRIGRQRRKALVRGAQVEPVNATTVFNRDNWTCYLCGIDTPAALRGTYEYNAPELEHVQPLSKGGAHSYANTRCACRRCNQDKGDDTLEAYRARIGQGVFQILQG